MTFYSKNTFVFHKVSSYVALAILAFSLAACTMPEKPEGADTEGMTTLGDQLRARGDDAGAVDFYQRSLQRKPDNMHARIAVAEILEAHGDEANAALMYREAIRLEPDNGDLHRDLGRALIRQGKAAEAKDEYEQALKIDSDDVKAMNGLGIALDYLGNHAAAQNTYRQALEENPDDLTTLNNLAHSYVLTGAYGQAIQLLEPHIKDKDATPALRQNLAEAYGMEGMDVDAERVGRMDLTPEQVKHNMDYYHTRRAELALMPKLYAELGDFPTQGMAEARVNDIKARLPKETAGLILEVTPEVKAINGTPVFVLRAKGFSRADKVRVFCARLKKEQLACKIHGG